LESENVKQCFPTLLVCLALIAGISCPTQGLATESAEDLLVQAEQKLVNSRCFAVNYTVQPENNSGWPGVVLGGRLVVQENNRCFLTNAGGFLIIPAALTIVSDEQSHLVVHSRGIEWVPARPGPINLNQIAGLLPRGGILPMVGWVVADIDRKSHPDPESKDRLPPLSGRELKVTGAQELAREHLPGGTARHIQFDVITGTNQPDHVDLWLDEHSSLPVKRVFRERGSGDLMTETYSFSLSPTLAAGFFDPRRLAREMKLEAQIVAAEKPAARLLRGALWGDEELVRKALEAGADANTRTPALVGRPGPQLSALMLASMSGNQRIIERLVKAGAEITAGAPSGATSLDFAVIYHHPEIVDWLRSHGGKEGKRLP
jgi:hypothetical protein